MTTKASVLRILEENRGRFFSGEEIASMLGVSRSAVWKAVKSLEAEGYAVSAVTNKGYCLAADTDILSPEGIRLYLSPEYCDIPITIHKVTGSTNEDAKALAVAGAVHGTMVLAEEQTQGRGRLGRSFYSPKSSGVYMSVVLRPNLAITDAVLITTAASVAVARAVEEVSDQTPEIKWVNDVFVQKKKICGILTEAVSGFESGVVECVVVGIGINVVDPGFPDEIKQVAGSLFGQRPDFSRNRLAALVANHLLELSAALPDRSFLDEYRKRSMLLGKPIRFLENNVWCDAVAVDVDNSGGLVIETAAGRRTLSSGEVSVRPRD
ncbi:biotin--[acetyl-CoA-carboxylase] ligase [Methanocorpusculum sp. MG]|uniref:Biotin--[acetyl-CoA-carboxylase] ligase n=1 Tax=Methanocorpusculum petauri TaxID=3002863 RepID=A0ABT4IDH3_9EURY|nr:biotin--[acetyl-CoA-carboxylase] ligase [Methanocorpusculum petauri]MCZ0859790.1 biotin--[acetyl-CoA-carboxylase] ligase [Methanocorpusculum petauri]